MKLLLFLIILWLFPVRGQPQRKIDLILIHCSAVRPNQTSSSKQIDRWHRAQGWRMIGYHYVVRRDGTIEVGRPESMVGAHCKGYNSCSIGVCYEGGLDASGQPSDTRTQAQKDSMLMLLRDLKTRYPNARLAGHNEFSAKACPCFDVRLFECSRAFFAKTNKYKNNLVD